ncbi:MAG: hypothetical protein M0P31_07450 [Solirubrobacteraceae bacterium]|nr:hypothetical protein [Solirubrobacteraceae bacterium]
MGRASGGVLGWVCGYGSLAALVDPVTVAGALRRPVWARLDGHRRDWGVAVRNDAAYADPKHYVDADSGERLAGHVAFLDAVPDPVAAIGVLALPVDAERLAALDAREVNYDRHDVGDLVTGRDGDPLPGRVWVFRGSPDGRARAARGRRAGDIVVSADYVALTRAAFAAQPAGLPSFDASTDPVDVPERRLRVVSIPELRGW